MAYKLIVADNSPSVQKVVQMAFSSPDFEVYPFEDGFDVLDNLRRINPDAVLLNLSLPGKDGYEVGRHLRSQEDFKKTVLVFLRNAFEPLEPEKMDDVEYEDIVQTPFDSEKLARKVRESIDRKKGPQTFPEESLLEEIPPTAALPLFREEDFAPPAALFLPKEDVEEKIRRLLHEEILSVERELEKRLKASLRAELEDWLEKRKKDTG